MAFNGVACFPGQSPTGSMSLSGLNATASIVPEGTLFKGGVNIRPPSTVNVFSGYIPYAPSADAIYQSATALNGTINLVFF